MVRATTAHAKSRDGLEIDFKKGFDRFPERPTAHEVLKIQEFVRETGCPEDHPDLCMAALNPRDTKGHHEIVGDLSISRKRRPHEFLGWCAVCQTWKFLDGRLVWSQADAAVRPVGHICASDDFGAERWRRMEAAYKREALVKESQYYLIETIPTLPGRIATLEKKLPLADRLQQAHNELFRGTPTLATHLERAARMKHGALTVERRRERGGFGPAGFRSGDDNSEFIEHTLGRVQGLSFLRKIFRPASDLRRLSVELKVMEIEGGPNAALDHVSDMTEDMAVQRMKALRGLLNKASRLEQKIAAAAQFLLVDNFRQIQMWTRDPDSPCHTKIEIDGDTMTARDHAYGPILLKAIETREKPEVVSSAVVSPPAE